MLKVTLTLLVSVLFIAVQGCAPAVPSTPNPNAIDTAIAQTLAAAPTQTSAPGIPVTGNESPTAAPTFSPPVPTPTPLELLSPSPVFTATAAAVPQVSVSTPTNCRVGPGIAYERVGGLQIGQVAEVVGRNATGNYWVIRNPERPNQLCWLWGQFATVTGNTGTLPVYTPPPTPTPLPTNTPSPSFAASYNGIENCTGTGWWAEFQLENTGGIPFESISLTVRDTTNETVLSQYADTFTNRNGCNETDTRENLASGNTLVVSSPIFNYDPKGRALRATITLCSSPGQNGMCVTQVVNFTP